MPVAGGTDENTAVYGQSISTGPADITSAGGLSAYGTMGQGGNVWEWNETAYDGTNDTAGESRELRGGSWILLSDVLGASNRFNDDPSVVLNSVGFRVASVPEPSAISLLAVGLGGLAILRRRRS